MAITKFLARDILAEVQSAGSGGSGFLPIGGLNSLAHSPSSENANTTDFNSNGRAEHLVAQRGDEWTLSGMALEDVVTGDRDEGQAEIEALARRVGLGSLGTFRFTSPGGNSITFEASAEVTLPSGGNNDAASWVCKLIVSGEPSYA